MKGEQSEAPLFKSERIRVNEGWFTLIKGEGNKGESNKGEWRMNHPNEGWIILMKGESKINPRKKINTTFNTEK